MKRYALFVSSIVVVLLLAAHCVRAGGRGPSTPEERAYARKIAADLEANPLGKRAKEERKAMLVFIIQIPDVSVTVCDEVVGPLIDSSYTYRSELMTQTMISAAVFVFDHPGEANNEPAKQLAGVRGMLRAYRSILEKRPRAHSDFLDRLFAMDAKGSLERWVKEQTGKCMKNNR